MKFNVYLKKKKVECTYSNIVSKICVLQIKLSWIKAACMKALAFERIKVKEKMRQSNKL